jgi:hypothetical protein
MRAGGLSDILPTTTWGQWGSMPGALAWSPNTEAPAPLANGGLFTGSQSTGPWASQPFPATQYAMSVEAAKLANNPAVFYQQRATDNVGGSWSPYVGQAHTPQHWSARMPSLPGLANVK